MSNLRAYKPGGLQFVNDGYVTIEHDTFTCRHCDRIVTVPHKCRPEDAGGLCYVCMGLVCPQCTGGECRPLERRLQEAEARGRMLRDMGLP